MYIELNDSSCFDILEEKSSATSIALKEFSHQQEVNNAYKAFNKKDNLLHFTFKTSTGTASVFDNYIFDSMSVEGDDGSFFVTMKAHKMSDVEVLTKALEDQKAEFDAFKKTAQTSILELMDTQDAQSEAIDYILMGESGEEEADDGEIPGNENQTGEA